MRLLVTGGTGFVGRAVVDRALADAHEVRLAVRDEARARTLLRERADRVEIRRVALTDLREVRDALDGADGLVHAAAGYSLERSAAARVTQDNERITTTVLAAAEAARLGRVVDVSSVVVLAGHRSGPREGVTDVDSPPHRPSDPHWGDPYLRTKTQAEQVVRSYLARGLSISSIHPGVVIGPEDRGPGPSGGGLLAVLRERVLPDSALGWCDVRDVGDAIVRAAEAPEAVRAIVCADTLSFRRVAAIVDTLTGRPKRRIFLPRAAIRAVARVNDAFGGRLVPDIPRTAGLEYPLAPKRIDGSSGRELLGREYRPLEETFADALRWWVANGMLARGDVGRLAEGLGR